MSINFGLVIMLKDIINVEVHHLAVPNNDYQISYKYIPQIKKMHQV